MTDAYTLSEPERLLALIEASGLFDADFYRQCYDDVRNAGIDPLEHFLHHGVHEGRDPSPRFSSSGYQAYYPDVTHSGLSPFCHYLQLGQALGRQPCPVFEGRQVVQQDRPTILLCGHLVEAELYGAELSLLDLARAFNQLGYNLVITVPAAKHCSYLQQLQALSLAVWVFPQIWWQYGRPVSQAVLASFDHLLQRYAITAVHANTLVHYEVCLAARCLEIPVVMHVRELPAVDEALCSRLRATPGQVRQHVLQCADQVIANSQHTAQFYQPLACKIIYNCVAMPTSLGGRVEPTSAVLRIGMISSNLPKKGLDDFVQLATILEARQLRSAMVLIGPDNEYTRAIQAQQLAGSLPASLSVTGYVEAISQALDELDIVVNLSHFQESFGRTVVEAMLAGKVVIAYRWGALPELLTHGEHGFLVPYQDVMAVADCIAQLAEDPERKTRLGAQARQHAGEFFSLRRLRQQLDDFYCTFLNSGRSKDHEKA